MSYSPESLLGAMRRRGVRWLWLGGGWLVVLVVVLTLPRSEARNIVRLIAVIAGPVYTYLGLAWLRLLPQARQALAIGPMPVRLETKVRHGYAFRRYLNAQIWPEDSSDAQIARFSETLLRAQPRYLNVQLAPARCYGHPTVGAVVVVTCDDGVLVGRVRKSNHGINDAPSMRPEGTDGWSQASSQTAAVAPGAGAVDRDNR